MKITNNYNISLPLAVWLLHDEYDYIDDPNYISATSLLRPIKQIILAKQVLSSDKEMDISEKISSTFGTAVHDSVQKAWEKSGPRLMKLLGYPDHITENIIVNPTDEYLKEHPQCIPVYFEKRAFKEIAGFTVGGKFDTVIDGHAFDYKTTSVWTYLKSRNDEDYSLQGTIYKWLNPELITDDFFYIQFIFTDWQKFMTYTNENYPKIKILEYPVPMKSMEEIEEFISNKLNQIRSLWDEPEENLPPCTDEELWRSEPVYKYYSDPVKANEPGARSTRNFNEDKIAAYAHVKEKGKGVVKEILGEVKRCAYCPAYPGCEQRKQYNV